MARVIISHENEIRVIGLFISLIAGALLVIMNIPKAIADCLGYRDAWRFDPNTLFVVLKGGNI